MFAAADAATAESARRQPLTERVLDRLGEPRLLWVVLWTAISFVRPGVVLVSLLVSGQTLTAADWTTVLLGQLAVAWTTLVGFWGVRRIWRGARSLAPELASLAPGNTGAPFFPGLSSTIGPVALTLGIVAIPAFVSSWQRWGPVTALADTPLAFVNALPSMTFVWTYLVLLVGLNGLGRARLSLDPYPQDRSLGLKPVGALGLTGFWLVLAAAIPLMIAGSTDIPTVVLSLAVIVVSVALFFLSMFRVHLQMVAAKQRYVAGARRLFADAYAPVRTEPSLSVLTVHGPQLQAAQALLERAERIQEWPIDERATAWVAVVVTGVLTGLTVRLILTVAGA